MLKITFAGATRTVTGSQYYFEYEDEKTGKFNFCFDSGLFQVGRKVNLFKVNSYLLFDPRKLDAIVLSHAHLDHCGRIPYLVKRGFGGKIYSTPATKKIAQIVLSDSAKLQTNEEAKPDYHFPVKGLRKVDIIDKSNRFKVDKLASLATDFSPDKDSLGLYNSADVKLSMQRFETYEYKEKFLIHPNLQIEFGDAGHILGSAYVILTEVSSGKQVLFSGDLGNVNKPIIKDPSYPKLTKLTHLITETTYGNRNHGVQKPKQKLRKLGYKTLKNRGQLIIPSFSVERAQEIIYYLVELMQENKLPRVPIFLDSPMAQKVLQVCLDHPELYDADLEYKVTQRANPLIYSGIKIMESSLESQTLNHYQKPCIIIAGSGMLTGGRIIKHLKFHVQSPKNLLLLVGYQAEGTLGREILEGKKHLKIEGKDIHLQSGVELISEFSAHADQKILLDWIGKIVLNSTSTKSTTVFLAHGEKNSSLTLGAELQKFYPSKIQTYWPYFGEKKVIWS